MKIKSTAALFSLYTMFACAATVSAQTALPYFSGFDNAAQQNGWKIVRKGTSGVYNWEYNPISAYSGAASLYHGYPVNGTEVTDDWFVSPPFTLTAGGTLDSLRHFFSGFGTPGDSDTLAVYVLSGNADPALATSKTLLYDYRGTRYNNDNAWHLVSNITIPPATGTSYIAIRYKTINNWLTVKFDNFRISGNGTTSINDPKVQTSTLRSYPNPVSDVLFLASAKAMKEVIITNMAGAIVYRNAYTEKIPFSALNKGIYLVACITLSGERYTQSVVKN